eukprot:gene18999-20911_t
MLFSVFVKPLATCSKSLSKNSSLIVRTIAPAVCSALNGRRSLTKNAVLTTSPKENGYQLQQSAEELNWQTRCELAASYRILYNMNYHEGICNHLSASCPARDGSDRKVMLLIPYGMSWKEVTASSLVGICLNENDPSNPQIIEEGSCSADISALSIHNGVHHSRPDMKCVMHTHTPNVTALTCLKDPTIQMLHQNSTRFHGEICYDTEYDGTATCLEEGFRLGKVLDKKTVMMMSNHGVMVLGKSVAEAFDRLFYLERVAELQILAMSTGKELSIIPDALVKQNKQFHKETMTHYADHYFNAQKRLIAEESPKYDS